MFVEKKLRSNAEKVSFVKSFPGRLKTWDAALGKTIERIVTDDKGKTGLLIFSDASFISISFSEQEPGPLLRSLLAAQAFLEPHYPEAYQRLSKLITEDKEMQRMARLENIMGAIENNLPQIPELKKALKDFLKKRS